MPERQIIECPYNPAMRAVWTPKTYDREKFTQSGGYIQLQFHQPTYGWCDVDECLNAFELVDHPLIALAKAHRMFKDETLEAFVEQHGRAPIPAL